MTRKSKNERSEFNVEQICREVEETERRARRRTPYQSWFAPSSWDDVYHDPYVYIGERRAENLLNPIHVIGHR